RRNSPKNNYEALQFILTVKENAVKGQSFYWGISLKDRPGLIGTLCLWNFSEDRKVAEVGYELLPEYHRKGLMSEALAAVVDFAFQHLSLHTLLAITTEENDRSQRLLLKQGFIPEKTEEDNGFPENKVFSLQGL
ncbi:GNAT family N-acetyltransferase, partial [uncultured Chryseobacterium sp.]|uniref:GNAT family N-acetyltransferase n=1 Tax=uncultured Chryseobacterium sp. TaxID=259322 RepID=UPI0025E642ED